MHSTDPDSEEFVYEEFGLLHENVEEHSLAADPGDVRLDRVDVDTPAGHVSAIRWGEGDPQLVLLHGTAQNAHTWDTVMLALGAPAALALDLPGHGRSAWREDARYDPHSNAETIANALDQVLEGPVVLVGMSLGGLTANRLANLVPTLTARLVVVDITPGVTRDKAREVHDFIAGPQQFGSFGEILQRTVEFNPQRSVSSLRRGILHNAHRNPDGTWEWNYHRAQPDEAGFASREELWEDVSGVAAPYLLVRGSESPVTDHEDVAELRRRRPDAAVEVVPGAGHSIQGDRPVELADLLAAELDALGGS
ncbi:MAG: alpha/beta hydrolase [Microthrixaceae bacterium]